MKKVENGTIGGQHCECHNIMPKAYKISQKSGIAKLFKKLIQKHKEREELR